jgi:hypothetical protein
MLRRRIEVLEVNLNLCNLSASRILVVLVVIFFAGVFARECVNARRKPEPWLMGFCKVGASILLDQKLSEKEAERRLERHARDCETCREAMNSEPIDFNLGDGW